MCMNVRMYVPQAAREKAVNQFELRDVFGKMVQNYMQTANIPEEQMVVIYNTIIHRLLYYRVLNCFIYNLVRSLTLLFFI